MKLTEKFEEILHHSGTCPVTLPEVMKNGRESCGCGRDARVSALLQAVKEYNKEVDISGELELIISTHGGPEGYKTSLINLQGGIKQRQEELI